MSNTELSVVIHPDLEEQLFSHFGIIGMEQLYEELPALHVGADCSLNQPIRNVMLYRARFAYNWGFSYVQIGTTLHVLDIWHYTENSQEVDVVLGQRPANQCAPLEAKRFMQQQ